MKRCQCPQCRAENRVIELVRIVEYDAAKNRRIAEITGVDMEEVVEIWEAVWRKDRAEGRAPKLKGDA